MVTEERVFRDDKPNLELAMVRVERVVGRTFDAKVV